MRLALALALMTCTALAQPVGAAAAEYFFRARPIAIEAAKPTAPPLIAAVSGTTVTLSKGESAKAFSATGGTEPYKWTAPNLPKGISLLVDGTLSADTSADAAQTPGLTATVTDAAGRSSMISFAVSVTSPLGSFVAFGRNGYGQSAPGKTANQTSPANVDGQTDWTKVAGVTMDSSCGIRNGDLYCWGGNSYGQLGVNGTASVSTGPRLVNYGGWTDISGSLYAHACGIKYGRAMCWGGNGTRQVGANGTTNATSGPMTVGAGDGGWTDITAGYDHSCGIREGVAYCWGSDGSGQLGVGSTATARGIVAVGGGSGTSGWTEISAGYNNTCGIRNGELLCWGSGDSGRLGIGGTGNQTTPTPVSGDATGWSGLVSGHNHNCAIKRGVAYCWGWNYSGQIGTNGTTNATSGPVPVGGGQGTVGWTMLAAGTYHTCGIRSGEQLCWGENDQGQLGLPNATSGTTLRNVGGSGWKYVAAGYYHTLAIR